ncbi:MAG TPA: DUF3592 domain-containing protein [Thermoanaerobaculia bacterium]
MPPKLAPPPRRVPLSLRVHNVFGGFAQVGWFLFGFGMIFVWVFAANSDLSFVTFTGPYDIVSARVTQVEATGASEGSGGSTETVMANDYQYSVAGRTLTGTSYSTGQAVSPGQVVDVQVDPDEPERSRIIGQRRAVFGPFGLIAIVFPALGAIFLAVGAMKGGRRIALLQRGLLAEGKFVSSRPTNVKVNRQRVHELTFAFTARDGRRYEMKTQTHDTARLRDDAREPLLYDPEDPAFAYLLDETPARPRFDAHGELQPRLVSFALLLLPLIVLLGHGVWMASQLG